MKIKLDKNENIIIFIPEEPIDYFRCGLIHHKIDSVIKITVDTDNPEQKISALQIAKEKLINELIRKSGK